jgi:hypothetical protein
MPKSGKDARAGLYLRTPPSISPLHHHLRYAGRFRKILLGDLGIENGKLRMENY